MSVVYDKRLFASFFKEIQKDESTDAMMCYADAASDSTFGLFLVPSKKQACLKIFNPPQGKRILFDIVINDLDAIRCKVDSISFYNQEELNKPALTLTLRPFIILECDDASKVSFIFERKINGKHVYTAFHDRSLGLLKIFRKIRFTKGDLTEIEYEMVVEEGLILNLLIWPYDEDAFLMLKRPDKKSWIFDVAVESLDRIVYENESLNFYKNKNPKKPALTVTIKPNISLQCCAEAPRKED